MSRTPAARSLAGSGVFAASGMPGYPLGPQPRNTITQVSSMSRSGSSIRAWKSSMLSNTTARPRCTSRSSRVTSQEEKVRLIHCLQIRHSDVLNPNGPADSSSAAQSGAGLSRWLAKAAGRARGCGVASWHRGRCVVVAGEVDAGVFAEFVEAVVGLDHADGAGLRPHHDRLGVGAPAAVADTTQQITVGDAGGGEEHVVTRDQLFSGQDAVEVVAGVDRLLAFGVIGIS